MCFDCFRCLCCCRRKDANANTKMTPDAQLITAIKQKNYSSIVQLYVDGVDGSVVDAEGNNLLHIAVRTNNVDVVKAVLLLFAYKYNLFDGQNDNGLRPIDLSYSSQVRECINIMVKNYAGPLTLTNKEADDNRRIHKEFGTQTAQVHQPVLLSLDGGGIRGLVMVRVLMHIERKLGYNLWKLIDWAAGTSTGGVLSLALSNGKSIEECQMIYLRMKNEVFAGNPPYNESKLNRIYLKTLSNRHMSSIKKPKLLITAARVDVAPPRLKLFRNYVSMPFQCQSTMECLDRGDKGLTDDPDRIHIWQVARCTSAAPSYFAPYNDYYADGGIIANNPTIELLSEFSKHCEYNKIEPKAACLISLGTGVQPWRSLTIHRPFYARWMVRLSNLTRRWEYYRGLYNCLVEQITESNGRPATHCRHWCNFLKVPFFRISPHLSRDVQLDEKNDGAILNMLWDTELYLSNHAEIDAMVGILRQVAIGKRINPTAHGTSMNANTL